MIGFSVYNVSNMQIYPDAYWHVYDSCGSNYKIYITLHPSRSSLVNPIISAYLLPSG
jgi:hypothetical protein